VYLNGKMVTSYSNYCSSEEGGGGSMIINTYRYKSVPSLIQHTSPTDDEFEAQKSNITTPSMPIDSNRYVDFISAKGDYQKIEYPNLFRVTFATGAVVDTASAQQKLEQMLDEKSATINALISAQNPSGLSGSGKAVYNLLSTGNYPAATVDLYRSLEQNPTLLRTAIEAVIWDAQKYPTEKYKYVFENFLDANGKNKVENVAHRTSYELASLG